MFSWKKVVWPHYQGVNDVLHSFFFDEESGLRHEFTDDE